MAEGALDQSKRYRLKVLPRIAAENSDFRKRIRSAGMRVEYSPDIDYLHVTFGEPRPGEAFPLEDGTHGLLIIDPETYEIVGLEAPSYKKDLQISGVRHEFWRAIAGLLKGGNSVYIPPESDAQKAEQALGALMPTG